MRGKALEDLSLSPGPRRNTLSYNIMSACRLQVIAVAVLEQVLRENFLARNFLEKRLLSETKESWVFQRTNAGTGQKGGEKRNYLFNLTAVYYLQRNYSYFIILPFLIFELYIKSYYFRRFSRVVLKVRKSRELPRILSMIISNKW